MTEYLELADGLLIAEAVLGIPADALAKFESIGLFESALQSPAASFGGVDFYPTLAAKAAVLCAHVAKNHGLPDGNKRAAFLAMVEFLERNGHEWNPPLGDWDGEETDRMIRAVAASDLDEATLAGLEAWIVENAGL
jgi:death-on-curing protein